MKTLPLDLQVEDEAANAILDPDAGNLSEDDDEDVRTARHGTARHTAQHSTAPHGTATHRTDTCTHARHGTAQHRTARHRSHRDAGTPIAGDDGIHTLAL